MHYRKPNFRRIETIAACAALIAVPALYGRAAVAPVVTTDSKIVAAPIITTAYNVTVEPDSSTLHVKMTVNASDNDKPLAFAIPAWTPGYYQILHYETDIANVRAVNAESGQTITLEHPSPREWRIASPSATTDASAIENPKSKIQNPITLTYDVQARDDGLGFFGSVIRPAASLGYINPTSTLMYVVGHTDAPATLALDLPAGWKVASPLLPDQAAAPAAAPIRAASYEELADSPVQFGKFDTAAFTTDGVPFRCVLVGKSGVNLEKISRALARVAHAEIGVFGQPPPFKSYTFYFHVGGAGFYGGLEHRNSTVIHLPANAMDGDDDSFLSVAAHELFHAWNVKYLRPSVLGPFDLTQPVRTASLWFAEGVTDYYADVALVRAGLRGRTWFYNDIAGRIESLDGNSSRSRVTLEEASRKAWEGGSEGFDGLSYYLKGSLVGLYFDLRLRALTDGQQGLDDVMRELAAQYGQKNVGYPENALLRAINKIAGTDLTDEYTRYVQNTGDINWNIAFAPAGLLLKRKEVGYLGIALADKKDAGANGDKPAVDSVESGQAGDVMGLKPGDRIERVNGQAASTANLRAMLRTLPPRSRVSMLVRRGSETVSLSGVSGVRYSNAVLQPVPNTAPTALQKRILDAVFGKE